MKKPSHTYVTILGTVTVDNWGYQLQGLNGRPLDAGDLASASHDMIVIDASHDGTDANRFSADEITRIKDGMGGRSVVASYISIGEANDFRDYWDKSWTTTGKASGRLTDAAPDWLGPINPDWPEGRKVRYWDSGWQDVIFNDAKTGDLDSIVARGFDAAYLDIVDAYYFWGAEVKAGQRQPGDPRNEKQAARLMVDFVYDMTMHARETNSDFFVVPQNGEWILDALKTGTPDTATIDKYYEVIGGIAVEDLYFPGGKDENNALRPNKPSIDILKRDFLAHGIPVYVVDYVNDPKKVAQFYKLATADGFIPYAAPDRDLDRLGAPSDGDPTYIHPSGGDDTLRGTILADHINGLAGNDRIDGRNGDDRLTGGLGKDTLTGDAGADQFVFASKPGGGNVDTIADFEAGTDTILLDASVFRKLSPGSLDASAFAIAATAGDGSVRILYNTDTGALSYDPDGSGDAKALVFARLTAGLGLSEGDFLVI